jgi:hypothetical protein
MSATNPPVRLTLATHRARPARLSLVRFEGMTQSWVATPPRCMHRVVACATLLACCENQF